MYGPIEIVAHQGAPCSTMFTLDQGCMCRWCCSYVGGKIHFMTHTHTHTHNTHTYTYTHTYTRTHTHTHTHLGVVSLSGWKYVEKGTRFGTDSLLLYLDRKRVARTGSHVATWFQSYQTLTFCA